MHWRWKAAWNCSNSSMLLRSKISQSWFSSGKGVKLLSRPSGTNLGLLVRVPYGETLAGTLNKETLAWCVWLMWPSVISGCQGHRYTEPSHLQCQSQDTVAKGLWNSETCENLYILYISWTNNKQCEQLRCSPLVAQYPINAWLGDKLKPIRSHHKNIGVTFVGKWSFVSHRNTWVFKDLEICNNLQIIVIIHGLLMCSPWVLSKD